VVISVDGKRLHAEGVHRADVRPAAPPGADQQRKPARGIAPAALIFCSASILNCFEIIGRF
jgi:hypothetical protein